MKMYLGDTQIKSMKVGTDTDDATLVASDLQAGVTAYARGQKVTGTGKSFEFAFYGDAKTNQTQYIPTSINIIKVSSLEYPIKLITALNNMRNLDFAIAQVIANITIDNIEYDITVQAVNNFLTISCEKTVSLEIFYGKDNYV